MFVILLQCDCTASRVTHIGIRYYINESSLIVAVWRELFGALFYTRFGQIRNFVAIAAYRHGSENE